MLGERERERKYNTKNVNLASNMQLAKMGNCCKLRKGGSNRQKRQSSHLPHIHTVVSSTVVRSISQISSTLLSKERLLSVEWSLNNRKGGRGTKMRANYPQLHAAVSMVGVAAAFNGCCNCCPVWVSQGSSGC